MPYIYLHSNREKEVISEGLSRKEVVGFYTPRWRLIFGLHDA